MYEHCQLDAEGMLNLFCLDIERTESEDQVVSWLIEYIRSRATEEESKCFILCSRTHACIHTHTHTHTHTLWLHLLHVHFILCLGNSQEGKTRATLSDLLQFLTGLRKLGLSSKISVSFHSDSTKVFPGSSACFHMMYLPRSLPSKEVFVQNMDKAILYSLNYFGQE